MSDWVVSVLATALLEIVMRPVGETLLRALTLGRARFEPPDLARGRPWALVWREGGNIVFRPIVAPTVGFLTMGAGFLLMGGLVSALLARSP
jgi:hypothetical protein